MHNLSLKLCIVFFLLINHEFIISQENSKLDSIRLQVNKISNDNDKLVFLDSVIELRSLNPETKLELSNTLIDLAQKYFINEYLSQGYLHKGNALQLLGDYNDALQAFLKCRKFSNLDNDINLFSAVTISIADTYSMMENSKNAQIYYEEGIELLRKTDDTLSLASALLNAGDEFYYSNQYEKALELFNESGNLFKVLNFTIGLAYNKGNQGMVYAALGQDKLAEKNISEAIKILEENKHFDPISVYLNEMSKIYENQSKFNLALDYSNRSLKIAEKLKLKDQISDANLQLSELHEKNGNYEDALIYFKNYKLYRDSIINIETVQKVADFRTELEVGKKQAEVDLLTQKRKTNRIIMYSTAGATLFIGIFAFGLYRRNAFIKKTNAIISKEKERSDHLLLNILPEETAQELKEKGKVEAKKFESVTVLFSDFKGFTSYAEQLEPEELVSTVDYYFSKFDAIIERYGLEKIKTVGDAYMVAGGLPFPTEDHALKMTQAAFDMAEFVKSSKLSNDTSATFDIRIGINTGPVVAGVVGSKKFAYDIWGDTVNIAARMESNSEPGKINVSESTFKHIKSHFKCEFRGALEAKNRGKLKMYFVEKAL